MKLGPSGEYISTNIRHPIRSRLFGESEDLEARLEELRQREATA